MKMSNFKIILMIFGGLLLILWVMRICYLIMKKRPISDFFTFNSHKKKKSKKEVCYTSKDRDLIELIHELSEIYRKTDEYMKS